MSKRYIPNFYNDEKSTRKSRDRNEPKVLLHHFVTFPWKIEALRYRYCLIKGDPVEVADKATALFGSNWSMIYSVKELPAQREAYGLKGIKDVEAIEIIMAWRKESKS